MVLSGYEPYVVCDRGTEASVFVPVLASEPLNIFWIFALKVARDWACSLSQFSSTLLIPFMRLRGEAGA